MNERKPKPSKAKFELREPAKPLAEPPARVLPEDHPMRELVRQATSSPPDAESRADTASLPDVASHVTSPPLALPTESHPLPASHPDTEAPAENLASLALGLQYRKGNLRINLDYLDNVVGKLSRNARLFYIYLLRYREGTSNYTVRLNWPTLEKKTDISRSVLHRAARELEAAGLAFSEGLQLGKGKEQGFRFRLSHTASHTVEGSLPESASHTDTAQNNRKDLTAKPKRDFSNCPTCEGRGYFYPEGFDKGVAKCRHEALGR